jgi:charged multivesicular body protein 2A
MMEFERQSEIMEMKEETIGDTMDDMMDDDDEEEETDNIINQVLDEIGINLNDELVDAPQTAAAQAAKAPASAQPIAAGADGAGADSADKDLEDRLRNLRKHD